MLLAAALAAAVAADEELVHRAAVVANMSEPYPGKYGIVNGRTTSNGQWDGVVMVVGSNGECSSSGLCSGTFIHPRVVMTAAHCCGGTKAICGGKNRPGTRLAYSIAQSSHSSGANDFCLLHLNQAVNNVPIYEVCSSVSTGDAEIVGYGVSNSGTPQQGAGTQRDGLVRITRVNNYDITITGRTSGTYQNACNGDSGGPIFVSGSRGVCVAGACSRGSLYCPANSNGIYTSAVASNNAASLRSATSGWGAAVTPGACPVSQCCYSMTCGKGPATRELPVGDSRHTVTHGGLTRTFLVYRPSSAPPTGLMMFIHGLGGNGAGTCNSYGVRPAADRDGYIGVCPDGAVGNSWNAGGCCGTAQSQNIDDVGFFRTMLTYLHELQPDIPAGKVYSSGMSNGGMMSYRLGCELSELVFGVAPVTGTMYPSQYTCAPPYPRPIIHLHGTVDFLVPYSSTIRDWRVYSSRIGCSTSSEREVFRSGAVHCDEYEQCGQTSAPGTSAFCTYTGMGHTWPGSNYPLPATDTVWSYFQGTSPLGPHWTSRAGFASVDLNITSLNEV